MILLEEIKNCVREAVAIYLSERRTHNVKDAAICGDEYVLAHKVSFSHHFHTGTRSHTPPQRPRFAKKINGK